MVAGLAVSAAFEVAGSLMGEEKGPGTMTEFTAVLMYGIGARVVVGSMTVAVVLIGVIALLLHLREPLHQFAGRMEKDIWAIMQFAPVILPLLPDTTVGPYGVLDPFQIRWMVILIVGLGSRSPHSVLLREAQAFRPSTSDIAFIAGRGRRHS